jgi:hypothetical protein
MSILKPLNSTYFSLWDAGKNIGRGDFWLLLVLQFVYWVGILHAVELPGLYMDAVNPEYLAARTLNPDLKNPVFALPTAFIPILGNLYHGVQNYYVGLPVFLLIGLNILALRIAQGLFGAITVAMVYLISRKATSRRFAAFAISLCLASDIAFIASFRTQFYIILGGMPWLLLSWYFASTSKRDSSSGNRIILSGLFFGLSVYAYFVYLFFLPVFIISILAGENRYFVVKRWALGFSIGMLTYVFGYVSLFVALKGVGPGLQWINDAISGLAPLSSKLTFIDAANNSLRNLLYALENVANELMIFGSADADHKIKLKMIAIGAITFLSLLVSVRTMRTGTSEFVVSQSNFVWLPFSYFLTAILLGNRLWVHHFAVFVPLVYLTASEVIAQGLTWRWQRLRNAAAIAMLIGAVLYITGNFVQQRHFFQRLEHTGGVGKMSNAINLLAAESRALPVETVHFFPEWGFFMPFSFLTGNRVPYELSVSPESLKAQAELKRAVRIAFWNSADEEKYRQVLNAAGFVDVAVKGYYQRDKRAAFYVISASPQVRTVDSR